MLKNLIIFFTLTLSLPALGQQLLLTGKITDSGGNPVSFASVYIKGTTLGTSANQSGIYQLRLNPGKYNIVYRFVGFKQQTDEVIVSDSSSIHHVQLSYEDYQLNPNTVIINNEDPAINIIDNAIENREKHSRQAEAYSCNVYIRGVQKLISAPKGMLSRGVAHELQLNLSSNSILYMSESASQFNFEQPNRTKEIMQSSKVTGNYNAFNFNRAADLQVDFYKNLFNIAGLNPRGFVSPIADNAFDYYNYKLLGTTTENGKVIDKIQVIPIDDRQPVFKGNIYIIENDWRIYSVHLFVTGKSNLNFVDTLNINQQYMPVSNNIWQPASVSFTYSGNVLGFRYKGYILGAFSNYNLDPQFPVHFFNGEVVRITGETLKRDSLYWAQNRPVPLTAEEQRNYSYKDSIVKKHQSNAYLDSMERANNKFSPLSYVFFGDTIKHRNKGEIISVNPLYDAVQYNTVEGWVIDMKPTYTKQLGFNRQYSISPEFRYGFDNKVFSINSRFEYVYNAAGQGAIYGRIGSGIYDINTAGSVSTFLNSLNGLFFKSNSLKLYQSKDAMLGTKREVTRGLLLDGSLGYAIRTALQNTSNRTVFKFPDKEYTSNNPYIPALDAPLLFEQSDALTLRLSATYTFGEDYTSTPSGRVYDESKYPKLKINYRKGIPSLFGSDINYDYADIQLYHDHINLGMYGYSAFLISAGTFFNKTALSYPDYKWFQGNQGFTFEPGISRFHFLPYYVYSSNSFLEAHYEHNFSGYLFNNIPGLRTLKLEEIIGGNYLALKDQPSNTELYVGIQRFFLRLDYGIVYRGNGKFDQGITLYYGL